MKTETQPVNAPHVHLQRIATPDRPHLWNFQCFRRLVKGVMLLLVLVPHETWAIGNPPLTSTRRVPGSFPLSVSSVASPLCLSSSEYPGVIRVAQHLQADIQRVTGGSPAVSLDSVPRSGEVILIGTIGRSPLIDRLAREKKLRVQDVAGRWEAFSIEVVDRPLAGIDRALVIAGSDKRGTIYGMYELSAAIGVSPWYWWADVPLEKQPNLFLLPGRHVWPGPKVKYRGIFINDEAPALSGWAREKFGGFNHTFYDHVFELVLRLRGNLLWPAMWGSAFYDDDSLNAPLANEYGVVIGTSHHEPMMRAHDEWRRYGQGPWNYEKNDSTLRAFWREGIRRMGSNEGIVTVGMRGDGDVPMSPQADIALLERIVNDQRKILGEVTGRDVTTIPQVWALYKEVQEYYDKGMRVPDDVTLLLCDDNWGNIRKLPRLDAPPRSGGYGIYYHFDYVGGPRNYKWVNTNQVSRVWEQMHLAYEYGARRIWIVNVGDIKPMEFPIEFFLDYAWDPDQWPAERLPEYSRLWAQEQFGSAHALEIAGILDDYTRYNSRRKPELLSPDTYSIVDYGEGETVVSEYNTIAAKAQNIFDGLRANQKDAFFQLVLYPAQACANLNEMYVTVGKNRLYARQRRATTNVLAAKARELFSRDSVLSYDYNRVMAQGKWDHMMDQTHIGYTYWQQPDRNTMPEVQEIDLPAAAAMGVAVEGSTHWWPEDTAEAVLPRFDPFNRQKFYIDLFNRGTIPFAFSVQPAKAFVKTDIQMGQVETEKRVWVSVDWKKMPRGDQRVPIVIRGPNDTRIVVEAPITNPKNTVVRDFVESNGYVSIEAEHYASEVTASPVTWKRIPGLGRTLSAMTVMPVTARSQTPGGSSPHLEYRMYLFSKGEVQVKAYLSPTLNFHNDGLRYAISFDDETAQVINMHAENNNRVWERWVANNINIQTSRHVISRPGQHVLKFWMVDPGVDLQKLVILTGPERPSYLGPPESIRITSGAR